MPGGFRGAPVNLAQGRGAPVSFKRFYIPFEQPARFVIPPGVTYDSTGAVLGNAQVFLFDTATKVLRAESVSDANGNFVVAAAPDATYFIVFYKAGAPDVAGTTVNTLVPVPA